MKPTENTFLLSINAVRRRKQPPNEKVELLESPESFELFDKFVRGERASETDRPITRKPDHAPSYLMGLSRAGQFELVEFLGYNRLIYATSLPTSVTTERGCV